MYRASMSDLASGCVLGYRTLVANAFLEMENRLPMGGTSCLAPLMPVPKMMLL